MVPVKCVGGWIGGVVVVCRVPQIWAHGKQFTVCFLIDTRQTVCLPCARKFAHGKSLDTRQTGRFRSDANPLDSLLFSIWFQGYP